jgi:hypothetical protein
MIDLDAKQLETVRKIVREHFPDCSVKVFGSRARATAKPYSDLDIAIICPEKIPMKKMHEIQEAFEISDLPIRVDVVDYNSVSEKFQEVINSEDESLFA